MEVFLFIIDNIGAVGKHKYKEIYCTHRFVVANSNSVGQPVCDCILGLLLLVLLLFGFDFGCFSFSFSFTYHNIISAPSFTR